MLRYDLLENGYHFKTIEPKKSVVNLIWAAFALLFIALAMLIYLSIFTGYIERINLPLFYVDIHVYVLNTIFIITPVIYFVLKELLTALASSYKKEKVEMKLHSDTGMAITAGREAFRTWQIIRIYLIPLIFIYPLLIMVGILSGGNIFLLVLTLIMSFYMAFDLTLVIYVLYLKMRYNADYVAIKNHVYMLTLYSKKYIEHREYADLLRDKLIKISKTPALKIICVSVTCVCLFSVLIYNFALNRDEAYEITPDNISQHSYHIMDAVKISAYLVDESDDTIFALERLNLNEARIMAATDIENLGLHLEINGIREIVTRLDIIAESEDIVLSHARVPPGGVINVFLASISAGKEYYLAVYAFREGFASTPRIVARLRLVVLEDYINIIDDYSDFSSFVSIELISYEITELDKIIYGIYDDDE
jgi:hypothetical protein